MLQPSKIKPFKASSIIFDAVTKANNQLKANIPVRVPNPFDKTEIFRFPSGTSEAKAKDTIKNILTKRQDEGSTQQKPIKLPELGKDQVLFIDQTTKQLYRINESGEVEEIELQKK